MSTSTIPFEDVSPLQRLVKSRNSENEETTSSFHYHHRPGLDQHSQVDESPSGFSTGSEGPLPVTRRTGPLKAWMLEGLSCLIAVISLGAIVITLLVHDSRELPDWPLRISVNALVSVFAVILKIAMLFPVTEAISQLKWSWFQKPRPLTDFVHFDDASRGLWGCTTLIVRLRGLHLASLGAFICLLATASDPFVQQVVRYVPCSAIESGQDATIARTNIYNRSGTHMGPLQESVDTPMQVAIYKGIYNAYTSTSPQCSTGNCTFAEYRTNGMCSGCSEVTSQITHLQNATSFNTNYTYEHIFQLPPATGGSEPLEVHLPYESQMVVNSTYHYNDSEVLVRTRMLVLDIYAKDHNPKSPRARGFECALAPCVRTYKASTLNGKTEETLISEHRASTPRSIPQSPYIIAPMPCLVKGSWYSSSAFSERNESNWRAVDGILPQNQTAWLPDECYFAMSNSVDALRRYLVYFLRGKGLYGKTANLSDQSWIELVFKAGTSVETLNSTWADIAKSITIQMRQAGTNATNPAIGEVWRTGTCIKVQWAWLAFPLTLLVASIVLLAATVLQSRKSSARVIWKSSPLAMLFHGLASPLRVRGRHVDDTNAMKKLSNGLYATLHDEGSGVQLVEPSGLYTASSMGLSTLDSSGALRKRRKAESTAGTGRRA